MNGTNVQSMTAAGANATASLADALDARERAGRPVRVGLIGAGQKGTDILVQTALMRGIEVVAAADAVPENVFTACATAGAGQRAPEMADDVGAAASRAEGSPCAAGIGTCARRPTSTWSTTDRKIYPPQAALHRTIWPFSRSPVPV